ncbi:hypothetical protein NN3_13660 [Nocardia neocaledoniensis NBRC 108232]|uniref:Uncharacterized protein n=1 Tax=Nocardia neocaledoniensis TaxID=236511 RepID=A0A317NVT9_9NOCA|nr:hypothetical protein [Nocardia neocaledoniensis]PWV77938.1 hypothetical protein DFR69_103538 [Nocardia neocaledoniensis]GEM30359.1 hypothetical protein NN3_13660 [Nocardia neocaledoniensis NBRC 108232]
MLAAPAQASTPGACLVIENNTRGTVRIIVENYEYKGTTRDIPASAHSFVDHADGRHLVTHDGSWKLTAPRGTWRYNAEQNWGGQCNGTWAYTVG